MKKTFDHIANRLSKLLQNSRARLVLLIVVVIIIVGVVVGIYRITSTELTAGAGTQVASVPEGVQSTPMAGSQSQQYLQTLLQANRQAAAQALRAGTSAIPTLAATPEGLRAQALTSEAVKTGGDCCCCPDGRAGTDRPTLNDTLNRLVSSGAISTQVASELRKLADQNISPEDYKKHLDALVAEGKLTKAQAAALEAAYRHDHANAIQSPQDVIDGLASSGAIDAKTAATLKKLSNEGLTPAQYADRLNQLVREGKLSPAAAEQLMAAYQKQKAGEAPAVASPTAADVVDQLAQSGQISPQTAAKLKALGAEGLSPEDYKKALEKMVADGEITQAQADQLEKAYAAHHTAADLPTPTDLVNQYAQSGQISPETAEKLKALSAQGVSPQAYRQALERMVARGELTQAQADRLAKAYAAHHKAADADDDAGEGLIAQMQASGAITPAVASQLSDLVKRKVSPEEYAQALRALVDSGQLSPAAAARLLQNYVDHNMKKAAAGGVLGLQQQQERDRLEQQVADFNQQALEARQQAAEETQAQIDAIEASMSGQATQLIAAWQAPKQQSVGGPEATPAAGADGAAGGIGAGAQAGKSGAAADQSALVKPGDIMFAVLNTAVNSDRPGPIMATIVAGKFKDAKLLGSLQLTPDNERVIISFNSMTEKRWPKSIAIQAVAINPDTAQTAVASDVDHHYLLRYSALFASSFLQGYSTAITQSGQTTVNSALGGSTSTTADFSPREKIMVGLGQVGQNASSAAQATFNRKPTVTVDSGVGLGILFTQEVKAPDFNVNSTGKEQSDGSA